VFTYPSEVTKPVETTITVLAGVLKGVIRSKVEAEMEVIIVLPLTKIEVS